jgi:hypothetical protein
LTNEFPSAVSGGADAFKRFNFGGSGFLGGKEEAGVPLDNGEDVVEIMGDSGRQLADGLHFLGLAQLVFELGLLGDVLRNDPGCRSR